MDPNATLLSLLCGHDFVSDVEALSDWLERGGFTPKVRVPADCALRFAACEGRLARAEDGWIVVYINRKWLRVWSFSELLNPVD